MYVKNIEIAYVLGQTGLGKQYRLSSVCSKPILSAIQLERTSNNKTELSKFLE